MLEGIYEPAIFLLYSTSFIHIPSSGHLHGLGPRGEVRGALEWYLEAQNGNMFSHAKINKGEMFPLQKKSRGWDPSRDLPGNSRLPSQAN